jgi:hypothetical protein
VFLRPSKLNPYIDTSFENNVRRVSPFLGTLLVILFGFMMMRVVYSGVNNLVADLNPGDAVNVFGTITLKSPENPKYGNLVQFTTTATGDMAKDAHTYIVTACFQDDRLVYQLAAKPGVKFHLSDMLEPNYDWDGGEAECNASLIYRVPKADKADLYMLDSISFVVAARS